MKEELERLEKLVLLKKDVSDILDKLMVLTAEGKEQSAEFETKRIQVNDLIAKLRNI